MTIEGSSKVLVSPKWVVSPSAIFLKILRIIFPDLVLGKESVRMSKSGVAIAPLAVGTVEQIDSVSN